MSDNVYPYEGGRCPHGSAAICSHCEPRRFKIAYVQTQALLAHGEHYTEEAAARVVDEAEATALECWCMTAKDLGADAVIAPDTIAHHHPDCPTHRERPTEEEAGR